jgi:hypothetical protein
VRAGPDDVRIVRWEREPGPRRSSRRMVVSVVSLRTRPLRRRHRQIRRTPRLPRTRRRRAHAMGTTDIAFGDPAIRRAASQFPHSFAAAAPNPSALRPSLAPIPRCRHPRTFRIIPLRAAPAALRRTLRQPDPQRVRPDVCLAVQLTGECPLPRVAALRDVTGYIRRYRSCQPCHAGTTAPTASGVDDIVCSRAAAKGRAG